jgi:hypothetical protein
MPAPHAAYEHRGCPNTKKSPVGAELFHRLSMRAVGETSHNAGGAIWGHRASG